MKDIEIVIKISEEEYNQIKENKFGVFSGHIFQAIRDGVPIKNLDSHILNDDVFKSMMFKEEC